MCGWGQGFGGFLDLCENVFFLIQCRGGGLSPRRSNFFISYKGKKVRSQNYSICPSFIESLRLWHILWRCFPPFYRMCGFSVDIWHLPIFGLSAASLALVALEVQVRFQASIYAAWKLEQNASSTSSTNFFSQYETHTQQAILWFCPVWLVIGVFSSSSNFPFRLWTRMFSTLSSCPNKKVDTFEIPVEYMILYILFLQKCRRAPRIPFPYTSISAI